MYRKLLLATDGSFNARQAEEKALALAMSFGSGIAAIYVIDRAFYQWAEKLMQEIYDLTSPLTV